MRDSIASTSTLELQHNQLQATVEALTQENQALREQVHQLQIELDIRDLYLTASEPDLTAGELQDLQAPTPRTEQALAEARPQGEWFVNFGSYFNPDTARAWSERLTPSSGRVTISTAGPEDRRLYRLRIVGLATREEAETMASKLEEEYKLDKLWVGNR